MSVPTASEDLDFSALGAPPPLAAALAEHDYQTAMPVQARVLQAADADLLVSSQTGSGKTVAFGLIIGRLLLGDSDKLVRGERPRALVVAPTRELAAQVQRELQWLFAHTGGRIVACTGGTDLRGDARALRQGVEIVVGTPGRLVDLVGRRALDLAGIQVLVLDEADEMLDLGFRESLETLLEATPTERRTLLFSATLPPGIRALARRFQKDAVAIDPRSGPPSAHEDIRHVAHLCADGERISALVNVLRLADDDRAIVFCRTRDNVAAVHAELTARGFLATAISGDREQAERTRALDALRQGRVRVLVATNVAARGLDLPDVGLVVHADLPENAEALTHRSGRTGRAGNKGVNLFIVERGSRRRAERLFQEAHLSLAWSAPPDADAVAVHDRARLSAEVAAGVDAAAAPRDPGIVELAEKLLADHDAVAIVALLVERALAGRPAGEKLTPVELRATTTARGAGARGGDARGAGARGAGARASGGRSEGSRAAGPRSAPPSGDVALFEINLGAKDRAEANWILPLVCKRGAITRREVGAIRVTRDRTYFEIARSAADEFAANAAERDPRAPHVQIVPATGPLPERSFTPPARNSSSRPPTSRAPTDRPATSRPPTDRPATSRPPTDRPATSRPPADRAPTSRPSASRPSADRPPYKKGGPKRFGR
jgi:ATP-dependent RNA helicase DeaD